MIVLLILIVGALLVGWSLRAIRQPLTILGEDSRRIVAGDVAHRSRVRGPAGLGDLAVAVNQLAERLQASQQALAELNRTLEQRVHEHHRQLEAAQAQLLQSEKLASIGQLAAGIAHELNNPLMVVMGNAQLALRMLGQPRPVEALRLELTALLHATDEEAHRARTIVANLLDFSRTTPPAQLAVDLQALLDESMRLVAHQASLQEIQVARRYSPDRPTVTVDPNELKQVFINVMLNAVQAMPTGGRLTLATSATATHVMIEIQDTGVGIAEEHLPQVFDPFFTTKEVGQGTGLGLSVSYSIVQRYQGTIDVTSHVGQGTTVTIQLPRTPAA